MSKNTLAKFTTRIAAAAGLSTLLGLGGSLLLSSYIMGGRRQTLAEAVAWQKSHYDISWFDAIETETYTVQGFKGYTLHVQLCKNPSADSRKYVILTHGYSDNRFGMLKYMKIYLDRGYHCIIYDLRGHGENAVFPCTYGTFEGRDLCALIEDTRSRYGDDILLGLHGESLGSATTVTALGSRPNVAFAVADCGFADIENVLRGSMKHYHLPSFFVDLASVGAKIRCGTSLKEMRPIDHLKFCMIPVMFIHGQDDAFILPENSLRMHDAVSGYKEYHLIPGATHANSVLTRPDMYRQYVNSFLDHVEGA